MNNKKDEPTIRSSAAEYLTYVAANDIFAENAWYFRNALVRANYNDLKNDVHETMYYLELFLRNLLLDEKMSFIIARCT